MLRLTGDAKALQSPALEGVRQDPQQLVSQYVYEGETLVVDFDPLTTENKLRQAGLPLWGANRPAILTWWLNSSAEGASLVGDGQEAAAPLQQAAQHRGLPLRLPLADLQEQLAATPESLGATQPDALRERLPSAMPPMRCWPCRPVRMAASGRPSGVCGWAMRASRARPGRRSASLADAVLLAVSERLAPRFTVKPGAASALTLEVQGANLGRFAELERLLEPFAARLLRASGDLLVWQVNASAEQLRAQLALAGLQEVPADAAPLDAGGNPQATPAAAPANLMRFRW